MLYRDLANAAVVVVMNYRSFFEWKLNGKCTALAQLALHFYKAVMPFYNVVHVA